MRSKRGMEQCHVLKRGLEEGIGELRSLLGIFARVMEKKVDEKDKEEHEKALLGM